MDYIYINKTLKTSIYKQIAASITDAIDDGNLKYNDKLPTEKEICQTFSISQTAVKMAYEQLISEGKIKRIKGKGTYVTNRKNYHKFLHAFYDLEVVDGSDVYYHKELILLDDITEDYSAYRSLKLEKGEKCHLIVCVVKSNQNPVALQRIYLPEKYFPDFYKKFNKDEKLFSLIEQKYHYQIQHLHSTFSPINASSAEALLLRIHPDDAIYFVRMKIVDTNNQLVGYVYNYFPGEFTEFEVIVHAI